MKRTEYGTDNPATSKSCGPCGAPEAAKPSRKPIRIALICAVAVLVAVAGLFAAHGLGVGTTAKAEGTTAKAVGKTAYLDVPTVKSPKAEDFLGTWYLNGVGDSNILDGAIFSAYGLDGEEILEIIEDGTVLVHNISEDYGAEDLSRAWTLEGDTLTMDNSGSEIKLTLREDGTLFGRVSYSFGNEQGNVVLIYGRERDRSVTYRPAAPVAAETAGAFAGEWKVYFKEADGEWVMTKVVDDSDDPENFSFEGTHVSWDRSFLGKDEAEVRLEDGVLLDDSGYIQRFTAQLLEDGTMRVILFGYDKADGFVYDSYILGRE